MTILTTAIAAAFIVGCGWLSPATPLPLMLAVLFVYGLARSLQFTTLGTLAYADVTDAQKAPASTLWSVAQQMTIGLGIAFGALCLRIAASARAGADSFVIGDFRWAFVAAGVLTLLSVIGYVRLPRDAGAAIGGGSLQIAAAGRPVR